LRLDRGTYFAAISGTHTIRPPSARIRAASSPSWLIGHPSSQPPCSSSVERRHTPVNPLSTSRSSPPRRNDAPPKPSGVESASATRRDHVPSPSGSCGPLTQTVSPRSSRAIPRAR
jgi:hypothetical protein